MGGSEYEPGAGSGVLGIEDLAVGDPGMIIDHRVAELIANSLSSAPVLHAVDPPPAPVGDLAEFLDIHMDQFPRAVLHIPDRDPRGSVQGGEPG